MKSKDVRRTAMALTAGAALAASLILPATAAAAGANAAPDQKQSTDEMERAQRAADVLEAMAGSEDAAIPQALLDKAYGVAVIPHVVKAALTVGGSWGKGLVAQRSEKGGEWSAPVFVSIGGASYGAQAGVQATDLLLFFTEPSGLDALLGDKLKLGADAGLTAGPIGRQGEVGTNLTLDSAIYSYSRSKGLFAGIALDGSVLQVDDDADARVYGKDVSAKQILSGKAGLNDTVRPFEAALSKYVRDSHT
jgi:lipid-binding SYLF domain-containing protein